jgi:hypothetical protein
MARPIDAEDLVSMNDVELLDCSFSGVEATCQTLKRPRLV